jgi:hypothetical protein
VFSGATWATAQTLVATVNETRITLPFVGGTYLIKAVDLLGNESDNATLITTYEENIANVVETITEHPSWAGTKDNVQLIDGGIVMTSTSSDGYYYFANTLDLGEVYECFLSASIIAEGAFTYDIYSAADIYSISDIYGGSASYDIYSSPDLYSLEDIYGGAPSGSWQVELQYRTTQDFDVGMPVWSDWIPLVTGSSSFEAAQFRIKLISLQAGVTPKVTNAQIVADMPDRIERAEDVNVPISGLSVTFSPPFAATPAIVAAIQNGAQGDRVEFSGKTASGFTVKVYNDVSAAYVNRDIDWVASGYGRVI